MKLVSYMILFIVTKIIQINTSSLYRYKMQWQCVRNSVDRPSFVKATVH
jgi:hypothetical protein